MTQLGRIIAIVGGLLLVLGALVWLLGKLGFRGLPGDISFETRGTKIYIPIVTCIVLSVILSAIVWLVRALSR